MPKQKNSRPFTVCLLSPHPGLLAELQRLLPNPQFKVKPMRLKFGPGLDPGDVRLPRASMFVIDASPARATAERLLDSIRKRSPKSHVIILKEDMTDQAVFPFLRLGSKGVLRYEDARRELARAVKAVAGGGIWIARPQLSRFMDSVLRKSPKGQELHERGDLSPREREVLFVVLKGLSNKEISSKLNISERTVKFHVSHLLQKFGVQRRADLILQNLQAWPANSSD